MLIRSPVSTDGSPSGFVRDSGLASRRLLTTLDLTLVPTRIADAIGEEIIAGRMAPEARVIEEEIAGRFGVSRSPVRESIRMLERDGLVLRVERRGARVSPLNRRNLDEIYTCRVALEGLAAAEAAARHTPENLAAMQAALAQMSKAFGKSDVDTYFVGNVAFTEAVQFAADHLTLRRVLVMLSKQARRYRYFAYRNFPHLMGFALDGSQELVRAIARRDGDGARLQMERLIERAWQTIRHCVPE